MKIRVPAARILLRSLLTANIERCERFVQDLAIIVVSGGLLTFHRVDAANQDEGSRALLVGNLPILH